MSVAITSYPGTSLRDDDIKSGRVLTIAANAGARYEWDLGVAMGRYLAALKEGHLVGVRCPRCQRILFPPRAFCELCFCPTTEWVQLPDTGTIQTFAICHIAWDATRIPTPKVPAVIAIDGATEKMGLLHLIDNANPERIAAGQRVRAVWRPAGERTGSITDILYFAPLEG
jgi:uncharacterized OB-fold protein